ncbi:MAG TPA: sigma-54 dependent transcriptional regulator, partial [Steroidobacteraceae bacterium]|nr:sigma-54 dependent transcriptional regulator [Steroidobacteraceae bacterium]
MRLPDGDGLDLLEWMGTNCPKVPCAVITAHGNVESAVRALKLGAFDFVSKPLDLGVLRRIVSTALKLSQAAEGSATTRTGTQLIGQAAAMEKLRQMILRVARSQAPVHISGESGTGKELVARMIHASGPRAEGPFVPVNCGAIPSELMESEFFGHLKGSFTGAHRDKSGLFQAAENGTLFLDEVADLPAHMQVKLLRALQERAVRPVGAETEIAVNVRVISATHKNLAELVAAGQFRQDLYYRLNVIEVHAPPLRARASDIPALAQYVLAKLARDLGMARLPALDPGALAALQAYSFPVNVRELENILERAATLSDGERITVADLQLRQHGMLPPAQNAAALGEQMEEIEKNAIREALQKTRYNKTRAAELLGMSFRALRYRIKKLGIDDE